MSFDALSPELVIAVVGTGAMGRGIAQVAAQAGITVLLHDTRRDGAEEARAAITDELNFLAAKGKLEWSVATTAASNLVAVARLQDVAPAHVVIEAIVENRDAKQALFKELEQVVSESCILATNTSSLSVTEIAAKCARPARVAGLHFFNPVPRMKLVEVVAGVATRAAVCDSLVALVNRMGHAPVRAQDTPGFVVNHAGRGLGTEALRLVAEGVAPFHEIDAILREQAGFRLGPFELFDLVGLDVSAPVMESIYRQYYEEPRFRPTPLLTQRLRAGLLGKKSGEGFYRYVDGHAVKPLPLRPPDDRPASVWVSSAQPGLGRSARALLSGLGAEIETAARPSEDALCFVTPLGEDVSTCCADEGLDPTRTVALDMLFANAQRRALMLSPFTSKASRDAAHGLLASGGQVSIVQDSVGLIAQRVVATIINIACDMAQQQVATPGDIDSAVTLGLGYPSGPLSWGNQLSPKVVLQILVNMQQLTGDPRYRPSPWLRRRAQLGVSLLAQNVNGTAPMT
ncbi:3-hydroxyacyl-CoA dehydrogenase [Ramlibacter sp. WS9]|uniref:3-hydroxyacyl-CoA dehydrogenase n=1 Tax=Ramlibacter sp. WS9 TaxID=1882741 RepID=UPI001141374E|nr:3-hydroxyacyl-CoA dehydrogenase [Ramlibacter sp. WS9]ROZ74427.1 3-hydroxyacyl-CoA dehydrogenase [Ramlibacter sp. WS9]